MADPYAEFGAPLPTGKKGAVDPYAEFGTPLPTTPIHAASSGVSGSWDDSDGWQRAGDATEDAVTNLAIGAGKSALGTLKNIGRFSDYLNPWATPAARAKSDTSSVLEPQGTAQKVGAGAEQVGEFFAAPEGDIAEGVAELPGLVDLATYAPKVAKVIPKVLAGGITGGAVATLHDQDPVKGAEYGAGGALANEAVVQPLAQKVAGYLPQRLMNAVARTNPKGFNYGRNPGQGVADEGLMAWSKNDMLDKIRDRMVMTGAQIGQHLSDPEFDKPVIDLTKAINEPIDQMEAAAIKGKRLDVANGLRDLKTRLLTEYARDVNGNLVPTGLTKIQGLTPLEANTLKQQIGDLTRWTGNPDVDQLSPAVQRIYSRINDEIDKAAPGIKDINQRYGELKSAAESMDHSLRLQQGYNPLGSLTDILAGLHWGPAGYVTSKVIRTVPAQSAVAQAARRAPGVADVARKGATGYAVSTPYDQHPAVQAAQKANSTFFPPDSDEFSQAVAAANARRNKK